MRRRLGGKSRGVSLKRSHTYTTHSIRSKGDQKAAPTEFGFMPWASDEDYDNDMGSSSFSLAPLIRHNPGTEVAIAR